jgi:hypothetical protein
MKINMSSMYIQFKKGFQKGYIPWNKGMKGYTNKGSFKKGSPAPKTAFKVGQESWNKGLSVQSNTGRTHFKKGQRPSIKTEFKKGQRSSVKTEFKKGQPSIKWMLGKKHSIETRIKMGEAHKGEKSHLWQGGISFEPYASEWTDTLKLAIRQRDNFTCQKCGKIEEQELKELSRVLSVNHIDYDKTNCDPRNLNTLCCSCNSIVNKNREYWTKIFQQQMQVLDN